MRKRYPCEHHPDYSRWLSMKQRCDNPNSCNYARYGAKGISYAQEFKCFSVFANYIKQLPYYGCEGYSLDRIDGTKGYEFGNLRWASQSIQVANQLYSGKGANKYVGVNWNKTHARWVARITLEGKTLLSNTFATQKEALEFRNQYIKENRLPHRIQKWIDE